MSKLACYCQIIDLIFILMSWLKFTAKFESNSLENVKALDSLDILKKLLSVKTFVLSWSRGRIFSKDEKINLIKNTFLKNCQLLSKQN